MGNGALKQRAVFLDRDGVINEAVVRDGLPHPPHPEQLKLVDEAAPLLEALRAAGFLLLVVTNQPDIARGTRSPHEIAAIHAALAAALPIDEFYVCPHDDADACTCRKPLPGLLLRGASEHAVDLGASYLVGDRRKDVEAGRAAGVQTVFIDHAYAERGPEPPADATVADLGGAVAWILNRNRYAGSATSTNNP